MPSTAHGTPGSFSTSKFADAQLNCLELGADTKLTQALLAQVANADFFLKMVPLFDAGDDVGMVLSPQAFHNIDVRCDVFNHSNVQFWEYAQVGYDALPFISCTGGPCDSVRDEIAGLVAWRDWATICFIWAADHGHSVSYLADQGKALLPGSLPSHIHTLVHQPTLEPDT